MVHKADIHFMCSTDVRLQFMLPPPSLPSLRSPLVPDFPLAAAANSHKCHVRQFVICVKDAAANASVAALESWNKDAQAKIFLWATRYPAIELSSKCREFKLQ